MRNMCVFVCIFLLSLLSLLSFEWNGSNLIWSMNWMNEWMNLRHVLGIAVLLLSSPNAVTAKQIKNYNSSEKKCFDNYCRSHHNNTFDEFSPVCSQWNELAATTVNFLNHKYESVCAAIKWCIDQQKKFAPHTRTNIMRLNQVNDNTSTSMPGIFDLCCVVSCYVMFLWLKHLLTWQRCRFCLFICLYVIVVVALSTIKWYTNESENDLHFNAATDLK